MPKSARSSTTRRPARPQVEQPKRASFTATEAKNEFGLLLERAIQGDAVVITKHDAPKAVLISMDEYNALKNAPGNKLNDLASEFDAMYERMQTSKARAAMHAAFHATPEQMGKAAVAAARKRG
jgi:antitoxin Phd